MNAFRTPVIADESSIKMRYGHAAMLAGSCFSMNIGAKLEERKFEVMCNPFGIIYNPVSLSHFLERLSSGRHYLKEDLITYRGRWAGPDHHGSFTVPDASLCLEKLNASLDAAVSFFDRVDFLFITLGTAWVYKWGEDKRILANCHKFPGNCFQRELLGVDDAVRAFDAVLPKLFQSKPDLQICFTLSPVRHWNDGPVDNNRSKSTLLLALHQLVSRYEGCSYFPAYEILLDELRDYRFYADDMLHPSSLAIDYIWEKFRKAWIDSGCNDQLSDMERLNAAVKHRPLDAHSPAHREFVEKQLALIDELESKYPATDFSREREHFSAQLD